jgi:hypothetical protein
MLITFFLFLRITLPLNFPPQRAGNPLVMYAMGCNFKLALKKSCSAALSWHLFFSLPHDLNYLVLYRLMIPYEHGNKIIPYHGCTVPLLFTSKCFNTNTFVIHQQLRYYSTSTILPII